METSELYPLSNSMADDSSDKSDSSVGCHFDVHLVGYKDYGRTNDFGHNTSEDNCKEGNNEEIPKNGQGDVSVVRSVMSLEETQKRKNAVATTVASTTSTTMSTSSRICIDDYIGDSSASESSLTQTLSPRTKSKGLLGLLSCNTECNHTAEIDTAYRECESKATLPSTTTQYKSKKCPSQQLKDELLLSLTRAELRQNALQQQQLLHGFTVNRQAKELNVMKSYTNLPFGEMGKADPSHISLDHRAGDVIHTGNAATFERLRGNSLLAENSSILERSDIRNLHIQSSSRISGHFDALTFERMRHSHFLSKDAMIENHGGSNSLHPSLTRDALTTQMQQTHSQQQQHQHQQAKSFTIDAILGLRNNQREKHRGQQYRKQGHEESVSKNVTSNSCSSTGGGGGGSGKMKRVRTIFTAEQLERLEGEFARQQYMVGPERLYLAHALRLTEAQVKVWFQNRRIKWRKVNHEQQSQRLHELHQRSLSSLEHEDSNENGEW